MQLKDLTTGDQVAVGLDAAVEAVRTALDRSALAPSTED